MRNNKILVFVSSILGVQLVGILGSLFTTPSIPTWYASLNKPAFIPPSWVFAPVWITLFLLIGISLGLVLLASKDFRYRKPAIITFAIQLALNLLWSFVFFYLHNPLLACVEIIILLVAIALNVYYAAKTNKTAGWLLVPYLLWVGFASILTFSVWRLN